MGANSFEKGWPEALEMSRKAIEEQARALAEELGDVVFKYIDRLNDPTPNDNLHKIATEMRDDFNRVLEGD